MIFDLQAGYATPRTTLDVYEKYNVKFNARAALKSVEWFWYQLKQKVYEGVREAKTTEELINHIKKNFPNLELRALRS